jgi:hypothetical protein
VLLRLKNTVVFLKKKKIFKPLFLRVAGERFALRTRAPSRGRGIPEIHAVSPGVAGGTDFDVGGFPRGRASGKERQGGKKNKQTETTHGPAPGVGAKCGQNLAPAIAPSYGKRASGATPMPAGRTGF